MLAVLRSTFPHLFPRDLAAVASCNKKFNEEANILATQTLAKLFPGAKMQDSVLFELHLRWVFKYSCTCAALTEADQAAIKSNFANMECNKQQVESLLGGDDAKSAYARFLPYLRCDWGEQDDYSRLGSSRVQGLPDLPLDEEWPCTEEGSEENVPWENRKQGVSEGLEGRIRICDVDEDESPLIFLAQINLAEAKQGFLGDDGSRPWPFPSSGILYFFLGESSCTQRVIYYDGPVDSEHLCPARPSVFNQQEILPEGLGDRGSAKRYVFSRCYRYLEDSGGDDDEYCSIGNYMVAPGRGNDVVLLCDNAGLQHGDCQTLVITLGIRDLLKRNFDVLDTVEPATYDMDSVFFSKRYPGYQRC